MCKIFGNYSLVCIILSLTSVVGVSGQNSELCLQLCRDEKAYCDGDCDNNMYKVEDATCQKQCNEDMLSCFDRCNGMTELKHVVPDKGAALISTEPKGHPMEPSGFVDVNVKKLSSEKIQPLPSGLSSKVLGVISNDNQVSSTVDSSSCVPNCLSLEVDCHLQCFFDFDTNYILDNDCRSRCQRNKDTCVDSCASDGEIVQNSKPEDVIVVVPNQITSLGLIPGPSQFNSVPEMSILRRILQGLPTTGTQMIGSWHS